MYTPQFLSVHDAASFLGVNPGTIRRWAQAKRLKGVKVGIRGDWRFTQEQLSGMIRTEKDKFQKIKRFLKNHARDIQKSASKKHRRYLGRQNVRQSFLKKPNREHTRLIEELAKNLDNLKKGSEIFKHHGQTLGSAARQQGQTLEEAIDGTIFLKQAFWEELEHAGLLYELTTEDFYTFSHIISTYIDIVASKIAFTYHNAFRNEKQRLESSQRKLEKEEHRWKFVFEHTGWGMAMTDVRTNSLFAVNPAFAAMHGYTVSEMIGLKLADTFAPESRKELSSYIRGANTQGRLQYESWHVRRDGSIFPVLTDVTVYKDKNGTVLFRAATCQDISEQKAIEEELEHQKDQLEIIVKNIADGITVQDKTGKLMYANDTAAHMVGYPSAETFLQASSADIIGKFDIMDENGRKRSLASLPSRLALRGRESKPMVVQFRVKDTQEIRWSMVKATPIFDAHKRVAYIINVFHEITEYKKAEDKIRQSEERYRAFLTHSSEAIWRFELEKPLPTRLSVPEQIDHMYRYAYLAECNDAMAQMYGYTRATDIIGARLYTMLVREDPHNIEYLTAFILSKYKLANAESHEVDKDGTVKYFSNNLVGIIHKNTLVRAWGTQRDITERKIAEQKLKESEERLHNLVSNVPGVVWEAYGKPDEDTQHIDFVSQHVEKMLGYTEKEWLTIPNFWLTIVHPEDKDRAAAEALAIFLSGKNGTSRFRWVTKDGRALWVEAHSSVITDDTGKPAGMRGVTMDISERMELEHRKDEFISIASHELKTPLTSIKAFTQILHNRSTQSTDAKSSELLSRVNAQIDKLASLVGNLLDVSKIQEGKIELSKESFVLEDVVRETVNDIVTTADKPRKIVVKGKTNARIVADKYRIAQVITNLLTNAIKYSPENSPIIVSLQSSPNAVSMAVQDFGIGIPKNKQQRIFERFYRVNPAKHATGAFTSLGLGLYISSKIIRRHEGTITLESTPGKGSIFTIQLPR